MSSAPPPTIASLQYRDLSATLPFGGDLSFLGEADPSSNRQASAAISEAEIRTRIEDACARTRAETLAAAEAQLQSDAERYKAEHARCLAATLEGFAAERLQYFRRVEGEVVHLALGIARKVIGREAEADPTLLSALVRIALERMNAGPAVRLRVAPEKMAWWQDCPEFRGGDSRFSFEFTTDPALLPGDCLVETDLGSANFSFESQLKEIERSFFDLLAQRPAQPAEQLAAGQTRTP